MVDTENPDELDDLNDEDASGYRRINPPTPIIINDFDEPTEPDAPDLFVGQLIVRNSRLYRVLEDGASGTPGQNSKQFELLSPPAEILFVDAVLTNQPGKPFLPGDTFIFNEMPIPNPADVNYNFETGVFTLYKGVYTITWQVMLYIAASPDKVTYPSLDITLMMDNKPFSTISLAVDYPMTVTGISMINVSDTSEVYLCASINNPADSLLFVALNSTTQAKMTIAKYV
jgi:hypothetical protein